MDVALFARSWISLCNPTQAGDVEDQYQPCASSCPHACPIFKYHDNSFGGFIRPHLAKLRTSVDRNSRCISVVAPSFSITKAQAVLPTSAQTQTILSGCVLTSRNNRLALLCFPRALSSSTYRNCLHVVIVRYIPTTHNLLLNLLRGHLGFSFNALRNHILFQDFSPCYHAKAPFFIQ